MRTRRKRRRLVDWQKWLIGRLVELRFTGKAIARVVGCSEGSVHYHKPCGLLDAKNGRKKDGRRTLHHFTQRAKKEAWMWTPPLKRRKERAA